MTSLTPNSLPVLVLCGIALYVGLANFLFYIYPRLQRDRLHLCFSLVCSSVALYDYFSFRLYNADSVSVAISWQRFQFFAISLFAASLSLYILNLVKTDSHPRFLKVLLWMYVLMSPTVFIPGDLVFSLDRTMVRQIQLGPWSVTYQEGQPGLCLNLMYLTFVVGLIYGLVYLIRSHRKGLVRDPVFPILGLGLFFSAAFLDILIGAGVVHFVYTLEYAFMALVILVEVSLARRIDEQEQQIRTMNLKLAQAAEQARESAQLKGELLSRTSHELRTPLNSIINIPENLLQDFVQKEALKCQACETLFEWSAEQPGGPEQACESCDQRGTLQRCQIWLFAGEHGELRHYLEVVRRSGKHLLGVVNDILDMSKIEAGRVELSCEEVELGELVEQVIESTVHLAKQRQIEVVPQLGQAPLRVEADPLRINQILFNLIGNAIKFSNDGGKVTVIAEDDAPAHVRIAVRDQGIGISKEDQPRLFTSFFQGNSGKQHKGTGLGLTITKKLVELHGGRIWFESELGQGTTFFVSLPRSCPQPIAGPNAAP